MQIIELIVLGFVASQVAVFVAASRNGLRAGRITAVSAIGYIVVWIFGALTVYASVGEKAPLGSALGWAAVSFAAIAFLKPQPQPSEDPAGAPQGRLGTHLAWHTGGYSGKLLWRARGLFCFIPLRRPWHF
jgi:hypothetical protein